MTSYVMKVYICLHIWGYFLEYEVKPKWTLASILLQEMQ